MALVHLHHSSGVKRSSSSYPCIITWVTGGCIYTWEVRGRAGFASAGAGKREGPRLQFVSNKQILNFISPFGWVQFLEVFCPKISFPQTSGHLQGRRNQPCSSTCRLSLETQLSASRGGCLHPRRSALESEGSVKEEQQVGGGSGAPGGRRYPLFVSVPPQVAPRWRVQWRPSHLICFGRNTLFRTLSLRNLEMIFSVWTWLNMLPSGSQLTLSHPLWQRGRGRCSEDTTAPFGTKKGIAIVNPGRGNPGAKYL